MNMGRLRTEVVGPFDYPGVHFSFPLIVIGSGWIDVRIVLAISFLR